MRNIIICANINGTASNFRTFGNSNRAVNFTKMYAYCTTGCIVCTAC